MTTAKLSVPSGGLLQLSAGEMSAPSHVNCAGMSDPGLNADVVSCKVVRPGMNGQERELAITDGARRRSSVTLQSASVQLPVMFGFRL